jgi:glyoxylase-like metal-dependent hydrolase (beta-lactamase superfamily II)
VVLLLFAGSCAAGGFFSMARHSLGEGLTFFPGGGGNAVQVGDGRENLLVDTKLWDYSRQLQREVEGPPEAPLREVKRILLTHAHLDHVGGVERFHHVGAVLVHEAALRRMRQSGKLSAAPWVEVSEALNLMVGGEEVRIFHPGAAHTDGDLVAYLPGRGLLVAGDVYCDGHEPSADATYGGRLRGIRPALERMLEVPFERVLGGHGPEGTRAGVERKRDYLAALEAAAVVARGKGLSGEAAVADVLSALGMFEAYEPIPFRASRESNARQMLNELAGEEISP